MRDLCRSIPRNVDERIVEAIIANLKNGATRKGQLIELCGCAKRPEAFRIAMHKLVITGRAMSDGSGVRAELRRYRLCKAEDLKS